MVSGKEINDAQRCHSLGLLGLTDQRTHVAVVAGFTCSSAATARPAIAAAPMGAAGRRLHPRRGSRRAGSGGVAIGDRSSW